MEQYLGTWVLEKSDRFDDYLSARGVPWLIRKMMQLSTITKTFSKLDDPGKYRLVNQSHPMPKTLTWDFALNESFENFGFEGKKHKVSVNVSITFEVIDDTLYETHIRIEESDHAEKYKYTLEDSYLVLNLQHKDIHAKRFFKRKP
uniref:Uncharacterized protein n=1 Tax=Romanomermis culicivorax TaxID=13658 RepID=A0A915HGM4_ROMCU